MISVSKAKKLIRENTGSIGNEVIELASAVGRVLAEDIEADRDLPPFDRSQMDGFAVRSADTVDAPAELRIAGESVAGKGWHQELARGDAVRIMTGAPVPEGADAVQKVELTEERDGVIRILRSPGKGKNIVRKGDEIRKGTKVFDSGEIVSKTMVATLASFGYAKVTMARRPKVAILATGSEVVDYSTEPGRDQIRNSNSPLLAAFAAEYADIEVLSIAHDDRDGLEKAISSALENCDCLIISGGVSVGDYDFTKPVLRQLGAEIHFEKLFLKPGKPTVFAKRDGKLIFGLPGNPVSIAVTFFMFVRMALLKMQNAAETDLRKGRAVLSHPVKGAKGRESMLPVKTAVDSEGRITIESMRFSGSSNFVAFANADAFVHVPPDVRLEAGDIADVYYF